MWKQVVWGIIGSLVLFGMASVLGAEEAYVVNNPNYEAYIKAYPLETKPRDAKVVEAEKQLCVEAAQAVVDYAKAHGVEQAAAEVTKGVNGAFAKYNIGPQFRVMIFQFTGVGPKGEAGDFVIVKGHNLFLPLVGVTIPVEAFADVSGWKFLIDDRKAAFSPQGKGWVNNQFWPDEFWAGNKIVRYLAYAQAIDRAQGLMVRTCTAIDE